jgi:hypothetical protein
VAAVGTLMGYREFNGAKFDPPGRCIYCGSDGAPVGLRDEHIIPFALGGRTILPKASCRKCEATTHAFEGKFAHQYFDAIRWQNNMPSRRSRKHRPTTLPIVVGKNKTKVDIPLADHPSVGYLLNFPPPRLFADGAPTKTFQLVSVGMFGATPDTAHRAARLRDGMVTFEGNTTIGPYVRSLAKIAHVLSVAERGLDGFAPFLTDFIRSGDGNVGHLIGGSAGLPEIPAEPMLHRLGTAIVPHDKKQLVVAHIRLFAYAGPVPVYSLVTGELRD